MFKCSQLHGTSRLHELSLFGGRLKLYSRQRLFKVAVLSYPIKLYRCLWVGKFDELVLYGLYPLYGISFCRLWRRYWIPFSVFLCDALIELAKIIVFSYVYIIPHYQLPYLTEGLVARVGTREWTTLDVLKIKRALIISHWWATQGQKSGMRVEMRQRWLDIFKQQKNKQGVRYTHVFD